MKLGFIGTGKITSSVVTGICRSDLSFKKTSSHLLFNIILIIIITLIGVNGKTEFIYFQF